MSSERLPFGGRFDRVVYAFNWVALAVGASIAALRVDSAGATVLAAIIAGAWVLAMQATGSWAHRERWVGELLAVAGAVAALSAMALTKGLDSPYLLLSIAPTLFAASWSGARLGLETALLIVVGSVVLGTLLDQELVAAPLAIAIGLQTVVAVAFSQARRFNLTVVAETDELRAASEAAEARLERLEAAHGLLLRFAGLTDPTELNPVTVGEQGLRGLESLVDFEAATVALHSDDGPVVVARRGEETILHHRTTLPLVWQQHEVGVILLSRPDPLTEAEREAVASALRPVAAAFANIKLLRDIARRAVREERVRLARELHDEIGPSLASLGLALDLALMEYAVEPGLTDHLQTLRSSVENLVEDIRTTVTDLRREGRTTLTQYLRSVSAELDGTSDRVVIAIDERRPPRPALMEDLTAILTEAVRNALAHSGARTIRVEGYSDRGEGKLAIIDDGAGFDIAAVPTSRFGLVGMQERAARLGGSLHVESSRGVGTTVTVQWGS